MTKNSSVEPIPKVLIVDDNEKNIFAILTILESLPLNAISTTDGEEALEIALKNDLALILLDVQMPIMSGFEVASILAQNKETKKIPILFVTAISKDQKYIHKAHSIGAVDYLFKPLDPTILKSKVMVFIDYYNQNKRMSRLLDELKETKRDLEFSNYQLKKLAHIDLVTNLPNRLHFEEFLIKELALASEFNTVLSVLYLDLDNFKQVNDNYGHDLGDKLLIEAARRIKFSIRSTDLINPTRRKSIVSRLGGDEFAIILTEMDAPSDAGIVAARILENFSNSIEVAGHKLNIGISIGIACYPNAGTTINHLQKSADMAMYRAKKLGKNNYQYFSEELNLAAARRHRLKKDLREVVETEQLSLEFQPILALKTKSLVGFEIICLWPNNSLGVVSQQELFSIAEEESLTSKLNTWFFKQATNHYMEIKKKSNLSINLHLNLSTSLLRDQSLYDAAEQFTKTNKVEPTHIYFEIEESALIKNSTHLIEKTNAFSNLGYKICLNDFGKGYSSLKQLQNVPASLVKINKNFIENLTNDPSQNKIIKSIVHLAHSLELKVLADGVDSKNQISVLQKINCDLAQGNFYAPPLPLDKFLLYLKTTKN